MRRTSGVLPVFLVVLLACGGSDTGGPDPEQLVLSLGNPSGNVQTAAPGATLAPFRVRLTRGGSGVSGSTVNWTVTQGGGTLNVPTTITDDDGNAQAVLTLGQAVGLNAVTASSSGAQGSPLTLTAAATLPGQFAQIEVRNNEFAPNSVSINVGGSVGFVWAAGSQDHNIVPVPPGTKPSQTTVRDGPSTHEESFNTAGTYRYFCEVHGTANSGMRGQIVVQ